MPEIILEGIEMQVVMLCCHVAIYIVQNYSILSSLNDIVRQYLWQCNGSISLFTDCVRWDGDCEAMLEMDLNTHANILGRFLLSKFNSCKIEICLSKLL